MNAREIVKALGGEWRGDYGTAPGPGHSAGDRSLQISDGPNGEPTVYSHAGDDWKAIKDDWRTQGLLPEFKPGERRMQAFQFSNKPESTLSNDAYMRHSPPKLRWSDFAESLWQSCYAISDDAAQYLAARRCVIPPADGDLRWHPGLLHKKTGWTGPALVARVTDAITGEPMTLHRTWIQADGTKAPIEVPRLPLKGHVKKGGVIRLWPLDVAVPSPGLSIAEGIETALSAVQVVNPAWALIDANNLAQFPVIDGVSDLVIFADNDSNGTGQKAAAECANRWVLAGRVIKVWTPDTPDTDLNDWMRT
jgi:putative DNA primase/helicase